MSSLPIEIIENILEYLPLCDLKSFGLTSRQMYQLCVKPIWRCPKLTDKISPQQLEEIVHLPIRELHCKYFYHKLYTFCEYYKVIHKMELLKTLYIDYNDITANYTKPLDLAILQNLHGVNIILHTYALKISRYEDFEDLPLILDKIKLQMLIIDGYEWSLEELRRISHLPATIHVECLEIDDTNAEEFMDLFGSFNPPLTLSLCYDFLRGRNYLFKPEDFKLFIQKKIRIKKISSCWLDNSMNNCFEDFVPYLENVSGLQEFDVTNDERDYSVDSHALNRFINLPIKEVNMIGVVLNDDNIDAVVESLSRMKHLESLLMYDLWDEDYKLTPNNLRKFCHLPIKDLLSCCLDINDANINDFRDILGGPRWHKILEKVIRSYYYA